jgi:hypothetical protein
MPSIIEGAFSEYTREQLEETLRAIDPNKNPADYAAVKAAISRALPAQIGRSCLDVVALRKLDALVQPSKGSKFFAVIAAIGLTLYLFWHFFLSQTITSPTVFWESAALVLAGSFAVWVPAFWKTSVDSYRFADGTIQCVRLGQIAWEQSLQDLVWVEEIQGRYGSNLDFHWPTSTRRVDLTLSDFKPYGFC